MYTTFKFEFVFIYILTIKNVYIYIYIYIYEVNKIFLPFFKTIEITTFVCRHYTII
jgi:hypothetical protein